MFFMCKGWEVFVEGSRGRVYREVSLEEVSIRVLRRDVLDKFRGSWEV